MSTKKTWLMLAIDGGGIRGIIPAYILSQLEKDLGRPVYQIFNSIGGTSTGGIISMGLSSPLVSSGGTKVPYTAAEVLDFYLKDEAQLFVKQSSGDEAEAKYYAVNNNTTPPTGIEPWLQGKLTTTLTLKDAFEGMRALPGATLFQAFTTCYTMNGASGVAYAPYIYNWISARNSAQDNYCVWEAARATSAAPTYFPIAHIGAGVTNGSQALTRWACDGGVAANNPSLYSLAFAERLKIYRSLSDLLIVSLGTGLYNAGIMVGEFGDTGNWGAIQWAAGFDTKDHPTSPLINVLGMANELVPAQQMAELMPSDSYYRLEPEIPYKESTLDGTDTAALLKTAQDYIAPGGAGHTAYQEILGHLEAATPATPSLEDLS